MHSHTEHYLIAGKWRSGAWSSDFQRIRCSLMNRQYITHSRPTSRQLESPTEPKNSQSSTETDFRSRWQVRCPTTPGLGTHRSSWRKPPSIWQELRLVHIKASSVPGLERGLFLRNKFKSPYCAVSLPCWGHSRTRFTSSPIYVSWIRAFVTNANSLANDSCAFAPNIKLIKYLDLNQKYFKPVMRRKHN